MEGNVLVNSKWCCFNPFWGVARCPILYRTNDHKKRDDEEETNNIEMRVISIPDNLNSEPQRHMRMLMGYPQFVCVTEHQTLVVLYSCVARVMGCAALWAIKSMIPFPTKTLHHRINSARQEVEDTIRTFPAFYPVFMKTPALLMLMTCLVDVPEGLADNIAKESGKPLEEVRGELACMKREAEDVGFQWDTQVCSTEVINWYRYFIHGMRFMGKGIDFDKFKAQENEVLTDLRFNLVKLGTYNERIKNVQAQFAAPDALMALTRKKATGMLDSTAVAAMTTHDKSAYRDYITFLERYITCELGLSQEMKVAISSTVFVSPSDLHPLILKKFMTQIYPEFVASRIPTVTADYISDSQTYVLSHPKTFPPSLELVRMLLFFDQDKK